MHVMLDLETMGNRSYSAIVSIGAVVFDASGPKETFYRNISLESCLKYKLQVDGSTIMWWMDQSDKAREALKKNPIHIFRALEEFTAFFKKNKGKFIWGNGSTFDNVILANAYSVTGQTRPWRYSNDRCFRTTRASYPRINKENNGDLHNALSDAIWQAEYLIELKKKYKEIQL